MIKINPNSWHYRLYSSYNGYGRLPQSLCSYFWAVVGLTLFSFIYIPFRYLICCFGSILFFFGEGFVPTKISWLFSKNEQIYIVGWKGDGLPPENCTVYGKLVRPKVFGFTIYPVYFLMVAAGVALGFWIYCLIDLVLYLVMVVLGVALAIALLVGLAFVAIKGIKRLREFETVKLVLAYVKAKKDRVCPLITLDTGEQTPKTS